jgi:hypothetical protein
MNEILGTLFFAFLPSIRYNKFTKEENDKENNGSVSNLEMLYYFIVDERLNSFLKLFIELLTFFFN